MSEVSGFRFKPGELADRRGGGGCESVCESVRECVRECERECGRECERVCGRVCVVVLGV